MLGYFEGTENFKGYDIAKEEFLRIENINLAILKILNLYNKNGYYNTLGILLADENNMDF